MRLQRLLDREDSAARVIYDILSAPRSSQGQIRGFLAGIIGERPGAPPSAVHSGGSTIDLSGPPSSSPAKSNRNQKPRVPKRQNQKGNTGGQTRNGLAGGNRQSAGSGGQFSPPPPKSLPKLNSRPPSRQPPAQPRPLTSPPPPRPAPTLPPTTRPPPTQPPPTRPPPTRPPPTTPRPRPTNPPAPPRGGGSAAKHVNQQFNQFPNFQNHKNSDTAASPQKSISSTPRGEKETDRFSNSNSNNNNNNNNNNNINDRPSQTFGSGTGNSVIFFFKLLIYTFFC